MGWEQDLPIHYSHLKSNLKSLQILLSLTYPIGIRLLLFDSSSLKAILRIRTDFGVTSTSPLSSIYSRASSKLIILGTLKCSMPPSPLERMFDNCFSLQAFTHISSFREFCPTTWPLYT